MNCVVSPSMFINTLPLIIYIINMMVIFSKYIDYIFINYYYFLYGKGNQETTL